MNLYMSTDLLNKYVDSFDMKKDSKITLRSSIRNIGKWMKLNGYDKIDKTEIANEYLENKSKHASPGVIYSQYRIAYKYCEWLIEQGKLSDNPWKDIDITDYGDVHRLKYQREKKAKENSKTVTLYDVGIAIIAAEKKLTIKQAKKLSAHLNSYFKSYEEV